VFDGREHIPLITIPGMRDRTVKIGSAGKIFGLTGWKVGFRLRRAARSCAYSRRRISSSPSQPPPNLAGCGRLRSRQVGRLFYPDADRAGAQPRSPARKGLSGLGFPVLQSQGTYFLNVDLAPLGLNENDVQFCKRIVHEHKVAAIPVSAFYEENHVTSVVRFCFSKSDATLDKALERLNRVLHR
jgi:N-succinyldiaminopimelate aminotransferase